MVGVVMIVGVIIGLRFYSREVNVEILNYLQRFYKMIFGGKFCLKREKWKVVWIDSNVVMNNKVEDKDIYDDDKDNELSLFLIWKDIG